MNSARVITTSSPSQTRSAPSQLFPQLKPGMVIALSGDLGSGKTTFTQGLANYLGVTKRVTSPTFVLLKQYTTPQLPGFFYHLDLYRIQSLDQVHSLDLPSLFAENIHIFAIEWPQLVLSILPSQTYYLEFNFLSQNQRQIKLISQP